MTDVNLLEAFWTLHDVTSAALATVVQSQLQVVSGRESAEEGHGHPNAAVSDKDLLDTVQAMSSSLEEGTAKRAVWEYIGGMLAQLPSNSGMMVCARTFCEWGSLLTANHSRFQRGGQLLTD